MKRYLDFPKTDSTPISVVPFHGTETVEPHMHTYYEFVLILKGACLHRYDGSETPLIPGDVFLIPPHREHSYVFQSEVTIINCHFYPESLQQQWSGLLDTVTDKTPRPLSTIDIQNQWDTLLRDVTMRKESSVSTAPKTSLNAQGIIHLNPQEFSQMEKLLYDMIQEQEQHKPGIAYMKAAYLQIILVMISRVHTRQSLYINKYSSRKKELIFKALSQIEQHFFEPIQFTKLAAECHLSQSYFRGIFKDVTGLSPIDYLNRIRIVKSLQYLQSEDISIADAAAKVGILDANYYSRLFKKIMGYSPRHFKNIQE